MHFRKKNDKFQISQRMVETLCRWNVQCIYYMRFCHKMFKKTGGKFCKKKWLGSVEDIAKKHFGAFLWTTV